MENHFGKNATAGKNIGRPIIVYDDDSAEKSKPSSSSGMQFIHSMIKCLNCSFLTISKFEYWCF